MLGVDEWAWKKGQRYGTILVDLERRHVVDLLPDRSADSFATWLQAYPSVEVISRDRSNLYADGAARGAPKAVQVADRWHLLHNLTDAIERILERRSAVIRRVAIPETPSSSRPEDATELAGPSPTPSPPRTERAKTTRRARRLDRYHQVVEMRQRGLSQSSIARQVGLDVRTIRRWLSAERFLERKERPPAPSKLTPHRTYLEARFREGCTNAAQL